MTERTKQHHQDVQEEEVLQGLFSDAMVREGQALPDTNEAEKAALPQIPEKLDAKCRKLIRGSRGKQRKVQFQKNTGFDLKRVAVVALVCLVFFASIATMSVDAIRLPVLNFLTNPDGRYSKILSHENEKDKNALLVEKILSVPLPEGYVLTDKWMHEDGAFDIRYENDESKAIYVSFFPSGKIINYDVEDAEQIRTNILNYDALLIKKNGLRILWMEEKYTGIFDIRADDLKENEFWEYVLYIAEL